MKTNDELETLIQNLIARMNRLEAELADQRVVVAIDPASDALDTAISIFCRAAGELDQRRLSLLAENKRWSMSKHGK